MKYVNASDILPDELIEVLQEYVQGKYIYIPVKNRLVPDLTADYKNELIKRNEHIYRNHLEGIDNKRLSKMYNLSESSIRRIIIKQRESYKMIEQSIKNIIKLWNFEDNTVKQIYDTTWQIGYKYILKVYSDKRMMKRNIEIFKNLKEQGIPVGNVIKTITGQDYAEYNDKYYFIYTKLSGSNIVKINNNMNLAFTVGKVIADLHLALLNCEKKIQVCDNSLLSEMNGWIKSVFEKNNWQYISKEEYEALIYNLKKVYDKLPVQLIHRDIHFGNFLFNNGVFSGYIDFDLSERNIRIFDLCYFLLGVLSEEEKLEIDRKQWIQFSAKLFEGYESKIKLKKEEKSSVPYVMESIELLFTAYFTKCDDVKCAKKAFDVYKFICSKENEIRRYLKFDNM